VSEQLRIRAQRGWIAYPGSTIQQNYAEDVKHGYLLWDIVDRDHFDVRFHELPNPKPFVTIEWAGDVQSTLLVARDHLQGSRFRVRTRELLSQKDMAALTSQLKLEMRATEVTFKNEQQASRDVISAGGESLARNDLRNVEVLTRLVRDYYADRTFNDEEWATVRALTTAYLQNALDLDDTVRNTKWSLRMLRFDNTFAYGSGNVINFDRLDGVVGIFGNNRAGKSSIVGTYMYALFNTTDRGSVKNLHVVNVRHPWCYAQAVVNVNGGNYIIERQTTKHESKKGVVHAGTSLNVFGMNDEGEAVDLVGIERKDTERTVRRLIGSADDCLLTSVAAQDDVKLFINQGTTKRWRDLTRFLDLDLFDKMHEQAKLDINALKANLRSLPDRDWDDQERDNDRRIHEVEEGIEDREHRLQDAQTAVRLLHARLAEHSSVELVTPAQVEAQSARVVALDARLDAAKGKHVGAVAEIERSERKIASADGVLAQHDLAGMRRRLDAVRSIESSLNDLKHVHAKDDALVRQHERSLKILDDVPCGESYPTCKFIKDAFKSKEKIDPLRERAARALERVQRAQASLEELRQPDLVDQINKVEQLGAMAAKLRLDVAARKLDVVKLEMAINDLEAQLQPNRQRLEELHEAMKNEENVELVSLRRELDDAERAVKQLDREKLAMASERGRLQSDRAKLELDRVRRRELLRSMRAHEVIAHAFSRRGIPNMIVSSQLPVINAEIAQILQGIVDFTVQLEQDDSDSMEIYIDYGDSRRIIELGSGMEKMIASVAIRVALINVSSLPKADMLIIDEGFGALDPSAVEACNRLLVALKRYFRTIIVITHVEGVKDVADHIIEVTRSEKDAKVVYDGP